ncbi:hypothetical protein HY061_01725, partial [Candidatus Azambacteria bacterium]|nr:hypothetical protein [Candidatus Azambacteria bacterium]
EDYLNQKIIELGQLSDDQLRKMREKTENRVELLEVQREAKIKGKYHIK